MQPTLVSSKLRFYDSKLWYALHGDDQLKTRQARFAELIAPLESQMMRSIWRIVRDQETAKDTLQEVLTIIWKKLEQVCHHPNPKALILRICANASIDALRKRKLQLKQLSLEQTVLASKSPETHTADTEVLAAISHLSKKQALAVLLRIVQDQPYDTIAQVLGCSEVTARIHVSKARKYLSRKLAHLLPAAVQEISE